MIDHTKVALGKKAAVHDRRVPLLKTLMPEDKIPDSCDYLQGRTKFAMLGNDNIGLCTSASKGHGFGILSGAGRDHFWTPSDKVALQFYKDSTGNNPPTTDDGGEMDTVLKYLVKHGYAGWRAQGYARIGLGDLSTLNRCVYSLGFADVGLSLPMSAQNQTVWDVPKGGLVGDGAPNSWGGHDALIVHYDVKTGRYKICTWDGLQEATADFVHAYVDEAYGWKSKAFESMLTGKAPNEFDDAALERAMERLA